MQSVCVPFGVFVCAFAAAHAFCGPTLVVAKHQRNAKSPRHTPRSNIRYTHHRAGETGFQRLKARRGICNPNPGFCSQLVRWGRRVLQACNVTADAPLQYAPRLFRVDFYYPANKKVSAP